MGVRRPQQARSRARVLRILQASSALIARHGTTGLTMSEVARCAGVPIGSVYQYFPGKSSLIHRLYLDRLEAYHVPAMRALDTARDPASFARALGDMLRAIHAGVSRDPLMLDIWGGLQADREIRKLHMADNAFYIDLIRRMAERSGSTLSRAMLRTRVVVIGEMLDAVILFALSQSARRGRRLVEDAIEVAVRELGFAAQAERMHTQPTSRQRRST
jgi:AcrR family transcriptional regulator